LRFCIRLPYTFFQGIFAHCPRISVTDSTWVVEFSWPTSRTFCKGFIVAFVVPVACLVSEQEEPASLPESWVGGQPFSSHLTLLKEEILVEEWYLLLWDDQPFLNADGTTAATEVLVMDWHS
jgi:hypothetical protein